jgi:hypothetical protein
MGYLQVYLDRFCELRQSHCDEVAHQLAEDELFITMTGDGKDIIDVQNVIVEARNAKGNS